MVTSNVFSGMGPEARNFSGKPKESRTYEGIVGIRGLELKWSTNSEIFSVGDEQDDFAVNDRSHL